MRTKTGFAELAPEKLRWTCPPDLIPVATSSEARPCEEIIGQERALRAIQTGLDIKSLGYNIFITGMVGTGRTTTIKQLLERLEKGDRTPDDILYVNNFKYPDEPVLVVLPAGQGQAFAEAMAKLIETGSGRTIPHLLKSPYYTEKRDAIVEAPAEEAAGHPAALRGGGRPQQGFTVIQVQMGMFSRPDLIPVLEGTPIPFAKLDGLVKEKKFPKEAFDALRSKYEELSAKLEDIFESLKEIDEQTRTLLRDWDEEAIAPVIRDGIEALRTCFAFPKIGAYLDEVEKALIKTIDAFKNQKKEEKEQAEDFLEYRVNLLVDNSDQHGAPVVMETNPSYVNLFGSIESTYSRAGMGQTDFTMIKAGSFLKANGGYLVINALDALVEPGVWTTLKRTLRNQIFEIQNYLQMYLFSNARLKPEPIKCDVKVVMIGDGSIYNSSTPRTRTSRRSSRSRPSSTRRWTRARRPSATTSASSGRSATRTISCPSTATASAPSSSTRPASPAGRRSCRRVSTSSPTSSGNRATGPPGARRRRSGATTSRRPSGSAARGST